MSDTLTTAPNILIGAADILTAQGWYPHGGYEHKRGVEPEDSPLDLPAAIAKAAGIDIHSHAATDPTGVHADAVMTLYRHVFGAKTPTNQNAWWALSALADWQDAKYRTAAQVIAALRGAAQAATGAEGPFYPHPGSQVPDRPGYLVAECGHSIAGSEWRARLRTCERCMSAEWEDDEGDDELPPLPDPLRPGQLYKGRDGDLLYAVLPAGGDWEFVTNRGTRVKADEARRVYSPMTLVRPVGCEATVPAVTEVAGGAE